MSDYNLIDEKWIPVVTLDGRRQEVGLGEALIRAREFSGLEHYSPLVTAALYRLLLAILYRSLSGPVDGAEAKRLFQEGWPVEKIESYFQRWRERFFLFDERRPFFQVAAFEPKTWRAWTVLACEHNADNAKVLFDHIDVSDPGAVSKAEATRWLVATQTFAVSAGKSEIAHTGTAPSATAALVVPLGSSLFHTLSFCLVPQSREIHRIDLPVWEKDEDDMGDLRSGVKRNMTGLADLYTWPSRSIRLKRDGSEGMIREVAFASGVGFEGVGMFDAMVSYSLDEKRGILPMQLRARGVWRDFDAVLPEAASSTGSGARVVENALSLTRARSSPLPRAVMILGQSNDKAKIEFWRMEQFALPLALSTDRCVRSEVSELLEECEKSQSHLWISCRSFAHDFLSHGDRDPDPSDVRKLVASLPTISHYWSLLEGRFHSILSEFSAETPFDEIRRRWLIAIVEALQSAWDVHKRAFEGQGGWVIRALVKAERDILFQIKKLREEARALGGV